MSSRQDFEKDLATIMSRLTKEASPEVHKQLNILRDWLLELRKQNLVKINHSVMELVCAKYLVEKNYEVQLEYQLSELLTCDLYGTKGLGNLIIEIETGFIPPESALAPMTYTSARLASKIIRYSSFAGKFALGVPPHYVLPFPRALAKPPRNRTDEEIAQIKKLCDAYYQKPPVTLEEIRNARIQEIYIIDVDHVSLTEVDPETYQNRAIKRGVIYDYMPAEIKEP
jgi:hypothetical protein